MTVGDTTSPRRVAAVAAAEDDIDTSPQKRGRRRKSTSESIAVRPSVCCTVTSANNTLNALMPGKRKSWMISGGGETQPVKSPFRPISNNPKRQKSISQAQPSKSSSLSAIAKPSAATTTTTTTATTATTTASCTTTLVATAAAKIHSITPITPISPHMTHDSLPKSRTPVNRNEALPSPAPTESPVGSPISPPDRNRGTSEDSSRPHPPPAHVVAAANDLETSVNTTANVATSTTGENPQNNDQMVSRSPMGNVILEPSSTDNSGIPNKCSLPNSLSAIEDMIGIFVKNADHKQLLSEYQFVKRTVTTYRENNMPLPSQDLAVYLKLLEATIRSINDETQKSKPLLPPVEIRETLDNGVQQTGPSDGSEQRELSTMPENVNNEQQPPSSDQALDETVVERPVSVQEPSTSNDAPREQQSPPQQPLLQTDELRHDDGQQIGEQTPNVLTHPGNNMVQQVATAQVAPQQQQQQLQHFQEQQAQQLLPVETQLQHAQSLPSPSFSSSNLTPRQQILQIAHQQTGVGQSARQMLQLSQQEYEHNINMQQLQLQVQQQSMINRHDLLQQSQLQEQQRQLRQAQQQQKQLQQRILGGGQVPYHVTQDTLPQQMPNAFPQGIPQPQQQAYMGGGQQIQQLPPYNNGYPQQSSTTMVSQANIQNMSPPSAINSLDPFHKNMLDRLDSHVNTFGPGFASTEKRRFALVRSAIIQKDDVFLMLHNLFVMLDDAAEYKAYPWLAMNLEDPTFHKGLRILKSMLHPNTVLKRSSQSFFKSIPLKMAATLQIPGNDKVLEAALQVIYKVDPIRQKICLGCKVAGLGEPGNIHFDEVGIYSRTLRGLLTAQIKNILTTDKSFYQQQNNNNNNNNNNHMMQAPVHSSTQGPSNMNYSAMFSGQQQQQQSHRLYLPSNPTPPQQQQQQQHHQLQMQRPQRANSMSMPATGLQSHYQMMGQQQQQQQQRPSQMRSMSANNVNPYAPVAGPLIRPDFASVFTETGGKIPGWKVALQCHLLSPLRTPAPECVSPLFMPISNLALGPLSLESKVLHSLTFELPEEKCANLAISKENLNKKPGEPNRERQIRKGSCLYRVRCAKVADESSGNITKMDVSTWSLKETCWPKDIFIEINGKHMELKRKKTWARDFPVDITDHLQIGTNTINLVFYGDTSDKSSPNAAFAVEVLEAISKEDIISTCKRDQSLSIEDCKSAIIKKFQNDDTEDADVKVVSADTVVISINCPISQQVLKHPVRGKTCPHLECFDLDTYLESRPKYYGKMAVTDAWFCPICNADTRPQNLIMDHFIVETIRKLQEHKKIPEVTSVIVRGDGKWKANTEPAKKKAKKEEIEIICLDDD